MHAYDIHVFHLTNLQFKTLTTLRQQLVFLTSVTQQWLHNTNKMKDNTFICLFHCTFTFHLVFFLHIVFSTLSFYISCIFPCFRARRVDAFVFAQMWLEICSGCAAAQTDRGVAVGGQRWVGCWRDVALMHHICSGDVSLMPEVKRDQEVREGELIKRGDERRKIETKTRSSSSSSLSFSLCYFVSLQTELL